VKTCSLCGTAKPLKEFYAWKHAKSRDGYMARCKACHRRRLAERNGSRCGTCGGLVSHASVKLCQRCRALAKRGAGSPWWKGGRTLKDGYVWLSGHFDHPNAVRGHVAEHVLVMTAQLGRSLLSEESVHHKNTIRDDNSPGNLELWSTSQPAGGRVEDKLAWARAFILQYHPEWLRL